MKQQRNTSDVSCVSEVVLWLTWTPGTDCRGGVSTEFRLNGRLTNSVCDRKRTEAEVVMPPRQKLGWVVRAVLSSEVFFHPHVRPMSKVIQNSGSGFR